MNTTNRSVYNLSECCPRPLTILMISMLAIASVQNQTAAAIDLSTVQLPIQYRCKTVVGASIDYNGPTDTWVPNVIKKPASQPFTLSLTSLEKADLLSPGLAKRCEAAFRAGGTNPLRDEYSKTRRKAQLEVCALRKPEKSNLWSAYRCDIAANNLDCGDFAFDADKLTYFTNSSAAASEMYEFFAIFMGRCEKL